MSNVALYLRKSRDEENESRDVTLARHEKLLTEYCDRHGLIIKKKYKEIVSGESISARFEMQKLLMDVKAGLFDAVVVVELERLSRGNQVDQAEILDVFKRSDTKIHTLTKVYDLASDNEIDEEFFEFGLFMSRREYKVINRRLMRGRTASLCEGYYTGSVTPYGFSKKRMERGFVLIPHESEAEIVKMIFNMYVSGETHAGIALQLNNLGIKQRNGKAWQPQRMRELLKNKTYIGLLHVKNPRIDATWIQGKHEPLIDEETFATAQRRLEKGMTRVRSSAEPVNPLAKFMICQECGAVILLKRNHAKVGYMMCPSLRCKTVSHKFTEVEARLLSELSEALRGYSKYLEDNSPVIEEKRQQRLSVAVRIDAEIKKKETMIERCCELLEEGIYTKEKYFSRVKNLEGELHELVEYRQSLEHNTEDDELDRIKTGIPILEKCLRKYHQLDVRTKNDMLRSLIEKVEYIKTEKGSDFDLKIFMKI